MSRRAIRRALALASVLAVAVPAVAQARDMYATDTKGNLLRFDSRFPQVILDRVPITGLSGGVSLRGIDFRPSTGQLVGLGTDSVVYVIDEDSGRARAVGGAAPGIGGTAFGVDVNPVTDTLRVTSTTGLNARLNIDTGLQVPGSPFPSLNPGAPHIVASGYASSSFSAIRPATTQLVAIDSASDQVLIQDPPDSGTLRDGKALGIDVGDDVGLDVVFIPGVGNVAYMVATPAGSAGANLYRVSLVTGRAFKFGPVGTGNPFASGRPKLRLTGFAARQAFVSPAVNIPPDVRIIPGDPKPRPGKRVRYLAYATDHDGGVEQVNWDTDGDGAFDDGAGEQITKAYSRGTHTIAVRVVDNSGGRSTDRLTLKVARR
jgi:hypothetical protein